MPEGDCLGTSGLHIDMGHDPNCPVVTVTLFEYMLAAPSGRRSPAARSAVLCSTTEPYGTTEFASHDVN